MNWIPLVATTVLTPLLTGVVVYLLQLRWQEQMEKRLTRFSRLHDRQAEVIAELYELLVEIQSDLHSSAHAVSDGAEDFQREDLEERMQATEESIQAFGSHFEKHRIYFPEPLAERIEQFRGQSRLANATAIMADIWRRKASSDKSEQQQYDTYLEQLSELLNEEIPPLKEDIEKEFRELLGS